MIPVLAIPLYNRRDLLLRCVASIDFPVGHLVITQNGGEDGTVQPPPCVKNWTLIRHPNAGVAASWNEAVTMFPGDYWLLVNNDIEFAPGDLAKFHHDMSNDPTLGCLYGNHGASWWGVTQMGIERVGLFDENFFPAYLEDCDWSYRADLLGAKRASVNDCMAKHGDARATGSCTIMSDPQLRRKNGITHGGNFRYYRKKWGGNNGEETFKTPFNEPNWPVWAWKFEPQFRKEQTV